MKARYIRISSSTQSTLRQFVKAHPDELVFVDVISGAIPFKDRPAAQQLIEAIEAGKVNYLSCEAVDRLGRSAYNIQSTIEYLNDKGVNLKIENLGVESFVKGKPNTIFKMITDVLANVAQMERESNKERQAQGIAAAIAKNPDTYKGRVKGSVDTDQETLAKYKSVVRVINQHPELSLRKIGSIADVSPNTVKKVKAILDKESKTEKLV